MYCITMCVFARPDSISGVPSKLRFRVIFSSANVHPASSLLYITLLYISFLPQNPPPKPTHASSRAIPRCGRARPHCHRSLLVHRRLQPRRIQADLISLLHRLTHRRRHPKSSPPPGRTFLVVHQHNHLYSTNLYGLRTMRNRPTSCDPHRRCGWIVSVLLP